MYFKGLKIAGFKSFAKKSSFDFNSPISAIVGPNGSGKSNVAEAIRFVLGEQSMKSLRGKRGEDLIWNGSQSISRSNMASVSIFFDNSDNKFNTVDYNEVVIKREVHRDGTNHYFINNSKVRLKDIIELLAKVNIGATGHHIISQGEADRILNANPKERREMIEETLGLKIYKWKISESQKKLDKTNENIKQVELLKKEIVPHLRFLKKQVEKVEKAERMREDLMGEYKEYLKLEEEYLKNTTKDLTEKKENPEKQLRQLEEEIKKSKELLAEQDKDDPRKREIIELEGEISRARSEKSELSRELGRTEGMIEYEKRRLEEIERKQDDSGVVDLNKVRNLTSSIEDYLDDAEKEENLNEVKNILNRVRENIASFFGLYSKKKEIQDEGELNKMMDKKGELEEKLKELQNRENELDSRYRKMKEDIEAEKDNSRQAERKMFEMMAEKSELTSLLNKIFSDEEMLERSRVRFKEELREAIILIGRNVLEYRQLDIIFNISESREIQEGRRKKIERAKVRLEDMGGSSNEEIMKEYEQVSEREEFLTREMEDLENSKNSLGGLIKELEEKLNCDFKEGIKKINIQFQEFFSAMFGGGTASLSLVLIEKRRRRSELEMLDVEGIKVVPEDEEEKEKEEGLEVSVSLPRKKIKGLEMLSGGERALTSIALIFAVSQVNPPPFLVLDETDAALDEANSKKYGDMLEGLSKHSQLVVITHNRETMSRAGILYGVTMDNDAVSKLLSVKFGEATTFAKS